MKFKSPFESKSFEKKFHYRGNDLGAVYSKKGTTFRVWTPTAKAVTLHLFRSGFDGEPFKTVVMSPDRNGTWTWSSRDDFHGIYYTYQATIADVIMPEAVDPYALAVGVNGRRAMVVDLKRTNPPGWERDRKPALAHDLDAVIYELHVRDFSIHRKSGIRHKGRFLAFTERGTKGPRGIKTGVDHLVELGVTHVHLLPAFDFASADETKSNKPHYNWGYDPQNYSVPEGSYASNAYDGLTRIREFKQMVQSLHSAGIRVVMDVVYNHTYRTTGGNFENLVPGYYYRQDAKGDFANGSGCGNETASDRAMVRKLFVESVVHWAREYRIDGFRFDLMGLHDLETMRQIRSALDRVDRSIVIYGEGWTAGDSPLPAPRRAVKTNVRKLDRVAAFSDTIRDAIKGTVWDKSAQGFVNGGKDVEEALKSGVVASTKHPQVAYPKGDLWKGPWATEPGMCVTYNSCHDNHALWDKIGLGAPGASDAERVRMNKLAAAIVLTSQGIAFLHAGEEFLRTKKGEENSYKSPDAINQLDWLRKARYREVFEYYRGLIALRRAHPAFRLRSASDIRRNLRFLKMPAAQMVGFTLREGRRTLVVIYNASRKLQKIDLPGDRWVILADGRQAGLAHLGTLSGKTTIAQPISALVLVSS